MPHKIPAPGATLSLFWDKQRRIRVTPLIVMSAPPGSQAYGLLMVRRRGKELTNYYYPRDPTLPSPNAPRPGSYSSSSARGR